MDNWTDWQIFVEKYYFILSYKIKIIAVKRSETSVHFFWFVMHTSGLLMKMAKKRHFENDFYESLDLTEGKRGHNNEFLWWSNLHIFCFLFNSNTFDLISNRNLRLIWWNDKKKIHRYPGKQLLFLHVTNTTPFSHSETLVVLVLYKEGIGEWVVRIYQKNLPIYDESPKIFMIILRLTVVRP